jgi:hypothetical protein
MNKPSFYTDYYSVPEYWNSRTLIPANPLELVEPVVGIRIEEKTGSSANSGTPLNHLVISYRSEKNGKWKPLVELRPINEDLHLFLLFSLRHFISENSRKKSWKLAHTSVKRTVEVVLRSLVVPVWCLPYGSAGCETNLKKIYEVMAAFRKDKAGEENPALFEKERDEYEKEIDTIFFELYELDQADRDLIT